MNLFVVGADRTVSTPALTGSILEGVTRSSILELVTARGYDVQERTITLAEVRQGLEDGSIVELFACGTAAVLTPIGRLAGEGFDLTVGDGTSGELTMSVREELTDIQNGKRPDTHGWMYRLA